MNKRDKNKRLKGFGIPVELCVRYERMAGVKTGEEPTPKQKRDITRLMVTALTEDGEVMAVQHKEYKIYGVQFHPESIMTPDGKKMLTNFIKEA